MKFGRVPEDELNDIDFSLPSDPAFNKTILKGKPMKNAKVYVGCAKWAEPNGWENVSAENKRETEG